MDDFKVIVKLDGKQYVFYGNQIRRTTTNGAGDPILYAKCWDLSNDNEGVINLNPDWTIKSIIF